MEHTSLLTIALKLHPRSVKFELTNIPIYCAGVLNETDQTSFIEVKWHTYKRGKYYKKHSFQLAHGLSLHAYIKILKKLNHNKSSENAF